MGPTARQHALPSAAAPGPLLAGVLFVAALAARLGTLSLPGTYDVEIQKGWAAQAAGAGLAGIYGPSDAELLTAARASGRPVWEYLLRARLPRTTFSWQGGAELFVDYPPGSLLVLAAAGGLYRLWDPQLGNTPAFNVAVNLAPLGASLWIAALLWRSSRRHGRARSLAYWANPAVLLAAPVLGYQDPMFAAPALAAILDLAAGRTTRACAWTCLAGLVKPQGVLLLPVTAVMLWRRGERGAWLRAAAAGAVVALVVLAPWWSQGHLLSALDGCRRPLDQATLAPLGLNVWWIAGWLMQWDRQGPWPLAEIATLPSFARWAGFDARVPARLALLAVSVGIAWWLARLRRPEASHLALALVLQTHAYALLATSVHENHTFLAVVCAPLLLGALPGARRVGAAVSAFLFANLFLMAGLGRKLVRLRELRELRALSGVDLSVLVALAHVLLVVGLVLYARAVARAPGPPSDDSRRAGAAI